MKHPFGALRTRNFRLHFAGQILSNVGTWFQSLAQALLLVDLTGSAQALGMATALQFAPMLLFGPFAGVVADRIAPRKLLAATSATAAVIAGTLAAVTALGHVTVGWVYGLALLLGCVQAFDRPTAQAFLYELVGPDDLSTAIGLHSVTQSSARMIGPALAGLAYTALGSATCFAINAVSFLCVIAALALMRAERLWPRSSTIERGAPLVLVRDSVRYALDRPRLRAPLLVSVLIGCFAFSFMTTITSMAKLELHGDAASVGTAHALNAAGAVAGGLLIASLGGPPSLGLLSWTCFAMAFTILVNALAPSLFVFLLWAPVFGFSVGAYQSALLASVQRATEPAMLGRISGLLALATLGVTPVASLISGYVVDRWSARAALALGAAACLFGALLLRRSRSSDALPAETPIPAP